MKGLKKLVLASAIIAASSSAFAMQAMDDQAMSDTTGQDGLTINLVPNLTGLDIKWIDRDGIVGDPTFAHAGAVHITPIGLSVGPLGQTITIDAGGNAGTGAGTGGQLRIGMVANDTTTVNLNNTVISVADAVDTANLTAANHATIGADVPIITFSATAALSISAGAATTIELGTRAAGTHFLTSTATLPSVSLTGLGINDTVGGGSINVGTISLSTVNSVVAVDVTASGLTIDTTGTTIGTVGLESIKLGAVTNASIGDVYISNVNASNVITVTGH